MYQRLDFFDWNFNKADHVRFLLQDGGLLLDYELVQEMDKKCSGYFEFNKLYSEELEYIAKNWNCIAKLNYDDETKDLSFESFEKVILNFSGEDQDPDN